MNTIIRDRATQDIILSINTLLQPNIGDHVHCGDKVYKVIALIINYNIDISPPHEPMFDPQLTVQVDEADVTLR